MSTLPTQQILSFIKQDLKKKMVFLGGPRQVGKTTLAQSLIKNYHDGHPAYLNWDLASDRKRIREKDWTPKEKLLIFDEIHKLKNWRTLIKGYYDTFKNTHSFLVTGSARLDHFRKGGDSLLGRYHYYRLHTYSLVDLGYKQKNLDLLFKFGGFPEPLVEQSETALRRWHIQRLSRLIRTDLRDLETVKDLDKVELLAEELPNRIGSPLSFKSLANDLEVDFKTAKRWVGILDSLYYCFLVPPFDPPKIKSVKKEQKLYLYDWSQIEDPGVRFENLVACNLLKYCHFIEDTTGHRMELRYLRDLQNREVDFVVLQNKKPLFAVEAKLKDENLTPSLSYFQERTTIPKFYQVNLGKKCRQVNENLVIMPYLDFCQMYNL